MENYTENYNNSYPPSPQQPVNPEQNNFAIASMIVGILALLSTFCCCIPAGFILGVIGIVLVILSKRQKPFSGFAIAGLILSILALIATVLLFAYIILVFTLAKDPAFGPMFNEMNDLMQKYQEIYESMPVQ